MPWSTTSAMTQRLLFIRDFELGVFPFSALCARYGVSRETGYAVRDLSDRSRGPV